jgi:two-component system nitrate/nitrite response regulator NarL
LKALQCEADGLLLSDVAPDVLIKSLELTLLGERLFPASAIQRICEASILRPQACDMQDADSILSTREVEVLRHLMAGQANKVIARDCGITESTVKVHVKAILRKIQAANRTQAAVWARRHGISDSVLDVGTVQELPRREKREL